MAMLAEPRRRQKWSVDPRNSAWSNDDSKFGQKMLERMGWSKGKGLGKSEQGSTEHIKVKVKNNSLGLGTTASQEDNWIAHQDDFNQLLAELNSCHAQSDPPAEQTQGFSLEEKSKTSKKRVHYMKFTKGKDLSSRSETDLNCIFGKRTKSSKDQEEDSSGQESQEDKEAEEAEVATPDKEVEATVNTVTSSLTMQEYFAQRMAKLKERNAPAPVPGAAVNDQDPPAAESKSKKKKKKKDRREVEMEDGTEDSMANRASEQESAMGRKKKRKRADGEMERNECMVSSGTLDQGPEDRAETPECPPETLTDNTPHIEPEDSHKRKKKKKRREEEESIEEEQKKSKKDKKKKRKHE
ncbi:hypothetical protein AGOR_G00080890 [Albula goreensis]|uniref:G-patch domain-containing protein n=1 Tax=Albula goreensis TaxID=1534307 RepID=A0A8T3DM47_9TELE|nr:hypothetical protein AGOR_G00080890 [Albula goreensis]